MNPSDSTTLHLAPGGHIIEVSPGAVPVPDDSRTARDVFAPGPGWTLMAGAEAPAGRWVGITRTADRVAVLAELVVLADGSRSAVLSPVPPSEISLRRLEALERWLLDLGADVRTQTRDLLACTEAALAEDRNSTAAEDAALIARAKGSARQIDAWTHAPALLHHGGGAADLLGELTVRGTPDLPFQRPMVALVAPTPGLDLTALYGALTDLGLSVDTVPEGQSIVAHLEETRMHCAAVVLGRHEDVPEGALDHWLERFLGPMLRVEVAPLRPAQFRTTEAGRLQLDPDLTPLQVMAAIRRHAEDRGLELG